MVMNLALFFAIAVTALVGVSLLRKQASEERVFPWFWVFFPLTLMSISGIFMKLELRTSFDFGWTMYEPSIYSSEFQPDFFDLYNATTISIIIYIVTLIVGVIGSVIAWKKRRI
ncbi:hypothetical membrane protein [Corynebacterium glutamicum]|nr:hypothetical membrane protein [Corynebacterium glutamicum]